MLCVLPSFVLNSFTWSRRASGAASCAPSSRETDKQMGARSPSPPFPSVEKKPLPVPSHVAGLEYHIQFCLVGERCEQPLVQASLLVCRAGDGIRESTWAPQDQKAANGGAKTRTQPRVHSPPMLPSLWRFSFAERLALISLKLQFRPGTWR